MGIRCRHLPPHEVRKFLRRALRHLTDAGIRQFVDIGCGLPTQGNVHEIAQAAAPDSRVAYVDNDPIVISHAQALLGGDPGTVVVQADIRDPAQLIAQPTLRGLIDVDLDPRIAATRRLAAEFDAALVPADGEFARAAADSHPRVWTTDGVHLTTAGDALLAEAAHLVDLRRPRFR